jgi:exopolyphosphatase/guanosine-5'-triphosphate,3'-diphosphate pyrophosphatase
MKSYQVSEYRAYGTSAVRETRNTRILLDQIAQRTGIQVEVLSNSEQRFLDYKSVAVMSEDFNRMLTGDGETAIVDIGGGSIQLSLFEGGSLVSSQNLKLGVLRVQEYLNQLDAGAMKTEGLVDEIMQAQLEVFKKLYLKDRKIQNIIIIDDYLSVVLQKPVETDMKPGFIRAETFERFMDSIKTKKITEIAESLSVSEENAMLLFISSVMLQKIRIMMGAKIMWAPGVTLCDGIAYEYAEKNKIIHVEHDFEADILSSAENISRRYMGSRKRSETLSAIAMTLFDSVKKIHGMGKRERLLLQLSAILHDCGKYVSMVFLGECSYNIIMSTEIIGISHREREMVANIVKYNHLPFEYYEEIKNKTTLDLQAYLTIAKLTAILRIANGLDRSHKQKFKDIKVVLRDDVLEIMVDTEDDITLEKGLFKQRTDFFEEVFNIRPVIKQKRSF